MIIAERQLTSKTGPLRIALHAPEQVGPDWLCSYEIDWPGEPRHYHAHGSDGVQALLLAMQMMAAELYLSPAYKAGELYFERPGQGLGLPLPDILKDLEPRSSS